MTETELTGHADDGPMSLADFNDRAVLVVNVASKCGLTPQYAALEQLRATTASAGSRFSAFRATNSWARSPAPRKKSRPSAPRNYGVTFPLLAKTEVNGPERHPLYAELTKTPDAAGEAGDVQWNFEKFLIAPGGEVVHRFRPQTVPDAPR